MAALARIERHPLAATAVSMAMVASLLALHYGTALHRLGVHDFLRGLFYVPVVVASVAAGWKGGTLVACVAAAGYLPHIRQLEAAGDRALNNALELVLMIGVAALIGIFANASRRERALAASRGRMAALGEVGLGMMLQAEGPLASIEGQAESIRGRAGPGAERSVEFAASVIQSEAARVRRLMSDLQGLGRSEDRSIRRVDLSAVVKGVIGDLALHARGAPCIRLGHVDAQSTISSDPRVLTWSLKALLLGLVAARPAPRHLEIHVSCGEREVILGIRAVFCMADAADLEGSLSTVFGPRSSEYQFDRSLCLHLLAAEGATIAYPRAANESRMIRLSFPKVLGMGVRSFQRNGHHPSPRARHGAAHG